MRPSQFLLLAALVAAAPAFAQNTAPPACNSAEHRQFDFWVGDWNVSAPGGKIVGTNLVTPAMDGCVLHEHWRSSDGKVTGESFNIYDPARKLWHQSWVDNSGTLLRLEGRLVDGGMVLSDVGMPGRPDPKVINQIAWTRLPDGAVKQLWRLSNDGGQSWKILFDGKYVRAARPQPEIKP